MKSIFLFFIAAFTLCSCSGNDGVKSDAKNAQQSLSTDSTRKIVTYYFYTTQRCPSCYKIETYSHEAISSEFADALQRGQLEWRMVNTDSAANKHFIEDFSLVTKSLVLVELKDGHQVRWKNCGKVWELLNNKPKFQDYVKNEVRGYLAGS
jgi:hypothetical protein